MTRGPGRPRNQPLPLFPLSPSPAAIRRARRDAGLTQREAGAVVYAVPRTWQGWEYGPNTMHPAIWELWLHKTAHLRGPAKLRR